jgi:hypothetical protein
MDGNEYRRCTALSFDFVRDVVLAQVKAGREGGTRGGKGGGEGRGGGGEDPLDNMHHCTSTRGGGGGGVVADDQGEDQPRSNDHVASFTSTPVAVKQMSVTVCFLCASASFALSLSSALESDTLTNDD